MWEDGAVDVNKGAPGQLIVQDTGTFLLNRRDGGARLVLDAREGLPDVEGGVAVWRNARPGHGGRPLGRSEEDGRFHRLSAGGTTLGVAGEALQGPHSSSVVSVEFGPLAFPQRSKRKAVEDPGSGDAVA
ncbi:hypothetical protein HPB52_004957 [Rhipicephalus sanguineus]|uniref:Uncharacterized protein n=1 Tax=Rhipicephalus sanguineus TaxID=34632 RepID=A0A9D4PBK7_RHISA|nr:hypothetical protein HPB52_004957 [Rhipicephalus sanguineus]